MYISELALHGFKSFANKQRLSFGEGITAVVGPNGCGKTNIVDAVRWVLGEQKIRMLRSARLDDIIFNGSDAKKALSVCEVSLTVHNNKGMLPLEYNDVEITRRIFRNGESEYMINRNGCRLKDIHNLFVDTGMGADAYSVIELKMIEDILSENADDRRRMFEEAAGINKYRHQRRATLLKLDATHADLERVDDIISEVENKVHSLQLQMKRYKRHAKLVEQLRDSEITLASLRRQSILKELDPLRKNVDTFGKQYSNRMDEEKGREDALEILRKEYEKQREEVSKIQTEIDSFSEERQICSNQMLVLSEQERGAEQTIERLNDEKTDGERKKKSHYQRIEELEAEYAAVEPKVKSVTKEYESLIDALERSDVKYSDAQKRLDSLSEAQIEHLKKLNNSRSLRERTEEIVDEKIQVLSGMEKRSADHDEDNKRLKSKQKSLIAERKKCEKTVDENKVEMEELESSITQFRAKKHEYTLEFHRIANRVETLESQLQFYREVVERGEGYSGGARHILNNREKFHTVLGTVADVIDVKEKYRLAVEAALGPVSQSLICEERSDAMKLIEQLSDEGMGRVWIIPLDAVRNKVSTVEESLTGVDASSVVKCESKYQPIVDCFLKGTPIVKKSAHAEKCLAEGDYFSNVVDLQGNLYSGTGLLMSPESSDGITLLGRKERIDSLDREIGKLVRNSEEVKSKINSMDTALDRAEKKHGKLSTELGEAVDLLTQTENDINKIEYGISQNLEAQQAITHEIISAKSEYLNYQKSLDNLIPILKTEEEKLATFQTKLDEAKRQVEAAQNEREEKNKNSQDCRIQLISLEGSWDNIEFRIKASGEAIKENDERADAITMEVLSLGDQIEGMKSERSDAEKNHKKLSAKLKKALSVKNLKDDAFRETYRQIEEEERIIREEQRERERMAEEAKRIELRIADHEGELRRIQERIQEKYSEKIPDVVERNISDSDLALEIDRLERSIERIGPINMAVKDEFEEENNRLGFLQRQNTDLLESEQKLLETMNKIDTAARKQFLKTFVQIRTNFKKTFTMFFEGGESDIELIGDDDPLEADINILAKPPGKHTRNLRMLSSGEKALTAISLLFAIYLVKPSPFCILDEVDAPLDDNNIAKFTRVLGKFSGQTQFIIVTHNKLTMEAAQFLYGVTMAQSGVSKIVSVQLD